MNESQRGVPGIVQQCAIKILFARNRSLRLDLRGERLGKLTELFLKS